MTNEPLRFAAPNYREHFVHYGNFSDQAPHTLDGEYVVVDVETSGLEPGQGARVIEIAAIRTPGDGTVTQSMHTLINPDGPEVGLTSLHGISSEMVSDAPKFTEVIDQISEIFSNAIFVAHHALFDERFVANEFRLAGKSLSVMPGTCTYWMSREVTTGTPNHKLATLTDHYNLDGGVAHSAFSDAMVVVQLLPKLLAKMNHPAHYVSLSEQPTTGATKTPLKPRI